MWTSFIWLLFVLDGITAFPTTLPSLQQPVRMRATQINASPRDDEIKNGNKLDGGMNNEEIDTLMSADFIDTNGLDKNLSEKREQSFPPYPSETFDM